MSLLEEQYLCLTLSNLCHRQDKGTFMSEKNIPVIISL